MIHEPEPKIFNYIFMYNKYAVIQNTNTSFDRRQLLYNGDRYIWVENGNDISGIAQDVNDESNHNTAFGLGLSPSDLYAWNSNYYTPSGSMGIQTTDTPYAYTYNNGVFIGKAMEYGKKYYLWFRPMTQTPKTWHKSQFYIDFKQWPYTSGTTLTFIIYESENVIPTTSTTLP